MSGYGLQDQDQLSIILENQLIKKGFNVSVKNSSISGNTSLDGLNRINNTLSENNVDLIILCLGANDMLKKIDPDITKENLEKIIEIIQNRQIKIILFGMVSTPSNGINYKKKFDNIFLDLSKKYDLLFSPFLLDGVALIPELNQSDGFHPNKKGIKIITKNINKIILKYFE